MTGEEYRAAARRIVKAEQLPADQRQAHAATLEALKAQAARFEFEHHLLALYRIPEEKDGVARIALKHLASSAAAMASAVGAQEYVAAQERFLSAAQQLLLAGAAMGDVEQVCRKLNLLEPVPEDPDCPF